jgi:hypothetical protein
VGLGEAEEFIKLYSSEYTDRMTSLAHSSYRVKGNQLTEFPEEEDLKNLKDYQEKSIFSLMEELKIQRTDIVWRKLAEVTLSRMIVFNARRGAEVAELTTDDYSNMTNSVDPSVVSSLTALQPRNIYCNECV